MTLGTVALVIVSLAALLFVARLLRGPTLADRVVSVDGFVSTLVIGVIIGAAIPGTGIVLSSVLVVVLGGFVGTSILARFIERRGG